MTDSSERSRIRREQLQYAKGYWSPFYIDAQRYTLAASGYTWSSEERAQLAKEGREPIEFNIIRQPIEFFSGYLRDNINQIVYSPVEGSDQLTADQFTKLSYYIWDKGKGYQKFLGGCDEMFKSGISLVGVRMDYSRDFINGDLVFFKRPYNTFYLDPSFEELDLSDCSFGILRDILDKTLVKQLLPFVDPRQIDELPSGCSDDKFEQYSPQFSNYSRKKDLMCYDQHYTRITKKRKFLVDLDNSFYRDITDNPKEEVDKLKFGLNRLTQMRRDAESLGIRPEDIPNVEIRDVDRPWIELSILVNGTELYVGDDKTGITETYPFAPLICYMEPSIWMPSQRVQGIASTVWSNQRQFNKRHMKIVDMMDSDISKGFMYLLGSVPDVSNMQQTGQNKLIGIDPQATMGLDSVREITGGGTNPTLIEYQQVLDNLSLKLTNINQSVMGVDEGGNTQVSGRLAQVRIAQGLMANRKVFDNIEETQQILGSLVLTGIQRNYPVAKVKRIINEEPTEQFYEDQFEQYDAVVKEGVRSKSQKDAYYYELVNLAREDLIKIPQATLVKALSMAGLSDLEKDLEEQDRQEAEQQKKIDAQEVLAMEIGNSQKAANVSLAKSRDADIVSKTALAEERASEAEENRAQAALARSKTITEIAQLEDDRILKVLEFVNMLEVQEQADRDRVNERIQSESEGLRQRVESSV